MQNWRTQERGTHCASESASCSLTKIIFNDNARSKACSAIRQSFTENQPWCARKTACKKLIQSNAQRLQNDRVVVARWLLWICVAEVKVKLKWISLSTSNAIWCYAYRSIEIKCTMHSVHCTHKNRKFANNFWFLSTIFFFAFAEIMWCRMKRNWDAVAEQMDSMKCWCWWWWWRWPTDQNTFNETLINGHDWEMMRCDAMQRKENSFRLNQFWRGAREKKSRAENLLIKRKWVCKNSCAALCVLRGTKQHSNENYLGSDQRLRFLSFLFIYF